MSSTMMELAVESTEDEPATPHRQGLPAISIPLVNAGPNWPVETLRLHEPHCHAFLDAADRMFPRPLLRLGDRLTRHWLARSENPYRDEIDILAEMLDRTGVYTFNLAYEWACLGGVGADITATRARFLRVLDYRLRGVGRHLVAVRIASPAGPWATITWPGYAGIVQGVAAGRFAACMNQPPSRVRTGVQPLDWLINHLIMWRNDMVPPEYLLRSVFETACSYREARDRLADTPIARPTIYVLAGLTPDEGCIIERTETEARILDGHGSAGNNWVSRSWRGYREPKKPDRPLPAAAYLDAGDGFDWLRPPFCNWMTRLAMIAEPASGLMIVQGREGRRPVTAPLRVELNPPNPLRSTLVASAAKPKPTHYRTTTLAPTGTR